LYYKFVMKEILAVSIFILLLCSGAFADDLDIGTHASFYLPPEGGGNTLMAGVDATYRHSDYVSLRGSVDNSNYQATEHKYSVTWLTLDLIYHTMGRNVIDPYIGAGGGLVDKKVDSDPSLTTTSLNALAGISMNFQSLVVGFEVKYIIPDTRYMETGFYSAGGNLTGGLHVSF